MTHQSAELSSADLSTQARRPVLGLMGEFSAGKTTLLNVLVERELLPTRVTATRVPPIWLAYGPEQAHYVDTDGNHHSIALAELEDVPLDGVAFIKIMIEADILRDLDIFDTPGISDPNISDEVRLAIVQHLDGVIWCTHATQAWRESERSAMSALPQQVQDNSILLVTRSDTLSPHDLGRVMKRMEREAGDYFREVRPMSSLLAAEAILAGDDAAIAESGFTGLCELMTKVAGDISARIAAETPTEEAAPLSVMPRRVRPGEAKAADDTGADETVTEDVSDDDDDDALRPDPDMASLLASMARIGQPQPVTPAPAPVAEPAPVSDVVDEPAEAPSAGFSFDALMTAEAEESVEVEAAEEDTAAAPLTLTPSLRSDELDQTEAAPQTEDTAAQEEDVFARLANRLGDLSSTDGPAADELSDDSAAEADGTNEATAPSDDVFAGLVSRVVDSAQDEEIAQEEAVSEMPVEESTAPAPLDLSQFSRIDPAQDEPAPVAFNAEQDVADMTAQLRSLRDDDGAEDDYEGYDPETGPDAAADHFATLEAADENDATPENYGDSNTAETGGEEIDVVENDANAAQSTSDRLAALAAAASESRLRRLEAQSRVIEETVAADKPAEPVEEPTVPVDTFARLTQRVAANFDTDDAAPSDKAADVAVFQAAEEAEPAKPEVDSVEALSTLSSRRKKGMSGLWRQIIRRNRIETVTDVVLALEDFFDELDEEQAEDLARRVR